ncbi:MAG: TRAP transporter permease [Lachnospiraceae bacterium]|nr:TRAP transporter permease [Lachnospiraceae bacterium]
MSIPNKDLNDPKLNTAAAVETAAASANEDMQARVDDVMKKFDRESNVRLWEGVPKMVVNGLLVAFSLFCIYVTLWGTFLEEVRLTSFMACIVFLGYLIFPAKKGVQKINYIPWYDLILMVLGTGAFLYFMCNAVTIIQQGSKFSDMQIAIGVVGIISLAEVCRRSVGLPILIVATAFIIYALTTGLSNPTFVKRLNYAVRLLFYSKEGILSTPVNTCSKFIVIFIIFGAFLERTGISDFFIDFANALVGSFAGGPAKVAVVSSALLGMVSGSSVANTVGSGSVTIPLMKKTGYRGEFAGAVEAAASTGGQIMPPIMGAAAFLMADIVGTPYSNIIVRAIIPAVLYFTGIFIAVHLEAKKNDLKGIPRDQLPKMHILIRNIYLLLPIVVLVWLVSTNLRTIQSSAAIAIVLAIAVSMFNKQHRMTPKLILEALAAGARGSISVAAACGIAGIIAGVITMTGLANVLINGIVALAGSRVLIALVLTMLCCIVLGMGVPTTANYCIMAATCAPILVRMGVPTIAAHFFVFYFGIVADITPPVALAAYAGAAIAQANPMRTALNATKLAIAAFIVPYILALNPVMVLVDVSGPLQIAGIVLTSLIGIFGVSSGLAGYLLDFMNWPQRILAIVGGLMLIDPSGTTDIIGIIMVALVFMWQLAIRKKAAAKA